MTDLPNSSKIPILTPDNILAVSKAYLKQLSYASVEIEDTDRASQFISTALTRLTKLNKSWEEAFYRLDGQFMRVLRYVPHFQRDVMNPLPEMEIVEWASANGMHIEYLRHLSYDYYIFRSYEDSVLFKLRWS